METSIAHLKLLLQETHSQTQTGQLLSTSLEATKVEIGVGRSLLTKSFHQYETLVMQSWVKNTWKFLDEYDVTVDDTIGDLHLCR